jgi:hypothetical protein
MKPIRTHKFTSKVELGLNHDEIPAAVNKESGEIRLVHRPKNNLPKDKTKLDYDEFGMLNLDVTRRLKKYFNQTEIYVIFEMINRAEFGTNSLRPLNDDLSARQLAEEFSVNKNKIMSVLSKLFEMGVYAQFKVSENATAKEYWILNPYIFWRGRIKTDSIFKYFAQTDIAKLFR